MFICTPQQIKGKGVESINGISAKYTSYKVFNHGNPQVSMSIANALFSGKDGDKAWHLNTKIYEQAFT